MGANTSNVNNRLYCELCQLTKNKAVWNEKIPYVASCSKTAPLKLLLKQYGCSEKWDC